MGSTRKPASDLKFCRCRACRYGLHHGKWGNFVAKYKRRSVRHAVKQVLHQRHEDVDMDLNNLDITVPYTD